MLTLRYLLFHFVAISLCVWATRATSRASIVDLSSPTTTWTPISYGSNIPDPSSDQQTGSSESDIVGNASHPSAYTTFDNNGTPSLSDGTLAFRVRLGADSSPAGFKAAMFVGIDANGDGKIDLFVGVCNSGSANAVGIWNPGNGLNVSPSTTSMVSPPIVSYVETASNYNWTRVSSTIDPTVGTATDINGDTQPDYFLSLSVPFADVLTQLAAEGITVNQNSTFSYVIATATQDNSLNQDLNGVNGGVNSSLTWAQLGAISDPLTAGGIAVVPEVNAFWPVTAVLAAAAVGARRRRRC